MLELSSIPLNGKIIVIASFSYDNICYIKSLMTVINFAKLYGEAKLGDAHSISRTFVTCASIYINYLRRCYLSIFYYTPWVVCGDRSNGHRNAPNAYIVCFTISTIYLLNFSMLTQLMDIFLVVDNMDDFATTSLMFLSAVGAFCKAVTVVTRRSEIINLIKILQEKLCKPSSEKEINIQMKYDNLIRYSIYLDTNVYNTNLALDK